jgi:hypothetical protein
MVNAGHEQFEGKGKSTKELPSDLAKAMTLAQ